MKKLLTLSAIALMVVFAAGLAIAGDYHSGTTNTCSDCHTMHFSRTHDMSGGAGSDTWQLGTTGPNGFLLKNEPNAMCLECHDGQTDAPDVLGAHANGYDRSAGALNAVGGVDGYDEWTGHTLYASAAAPGGTWTPGTHGLSCIDCHAQHGNVSSGSLDAAGNAVTSAYRNVRSWGPSGARGSISYSIGDTPDITKDVHEAYGPGSAMADHYGQDNINLLEPASTKSGTASFCKGCHTDFHGAKGGAELGGATGEEWLRHPTADANIGAIGGGHSGSTILGAKLYRVRVMSATGNWGTQGTAWTAPTDLTPTCLSCHKAHGNASAFGLIMATGASEIGEDGDGTAMKDLCKQCHKQG